MPAQNKQKRHLAAIRANRLARGYIPKRLLDSVDADVAEGPFPADDDEEQNPKTAATAAVAHHDREGGEETEEEHEHPDVKDVEESPVPEQEQVGGRDRALV